MESLIELEQLMEGLEILFQHQMETGQTSAAVKTAKKQLRLAKHMRRTQAILAGQRIRVDRN